MLAILCPGQGAQTSGFLTNWCQLDDFRKQIDLFSQEIELDLADLGVNSDDETIKNTAIAQPLLTAAAIAIWRILSDFKQISADSLTAGHSVGEIGAAAIAGVFDDISAMRFVAARGQAMNLAASKAKTSMSAILAGKEDEILDKLAELDLTPANFNGKGQIVAAGLVENLAKLSANPPARCRIVPLSVAGAFHTEYMASALVALADIASKLTVNDPANILLSNRDGAQVLTGNDFLARLVSQVCKPVRWDLCMKTMREKNVTAILELAPGNTLTGIAKRNLPGVELFNLNQPEQLADAKEFVAKHIGEK